MKKLIVILGPTASGKSEMAVKLALWLCSNRVKKKFKINGAEIISADSRQVYKGMDIGTGKITKKEMKSIPHHLLNIASPKRKFTVVQYQKLALKTINEIFKKDKIPILCGGTGFYISAVIDGLIFPKIKPDWKLRTKFEKKNIEQLFKLLEKLDPRRAKTIEKKNKRRIIRALEIIIKTKKPIPILKKQTPKFKILIIGIKKSPQELKKLIKIRLKKRFKKGMLAEIKKLKSSLSWKRLEEFGLEYRWIAYYLQNKINYKEMIEKLQKEIEHFAKRQMTWFKKDKRIHWIKNQKEAEKLVKNFLAK